MARPLKALAEKRTEVAVIRLTVPELEEIRHQAETAGVSVSDFVRRRALSYRIPTRERMSGHGRLIAALNRIGVNVNQIARAANSDREYGGDWREVQEQLLQAIDELVATYDPED